MQLEDYFDFSDPNEIQIKGHRIWIQHVLYPYLEQHKTPEQIQADLPTLSLDKVYATILYYLLNKEAVDQNLRDLQEAMERGRAAQPPLSAEARERFRRARIELDARRAAAAGGARESELSPR